MGNLLYRGADLISFSVVLSKPSLILIYSKPCSISLILSLSLSLSLSFSHYELHNLSSSQTIGISVLKTCAWLWSIYHCNIPFVLKSLLCISNTNDIFLFESLLTMWLPFCASRNVWYVIIQLYAKYLWNKIIMYGVFTVHELLFTHNLVL